MKTKTLRIIIPIALIALIAIGFGTNVGIGTLAGFGWQDISLLCPLGALTTMLASKLLVPRALISIIVAVILILLVGRAFCAWACPVPVVAKLRDAFSKKKAGADEKALDAPLSPDEMAMLKGCGAKGGNEKKGACSSCSEKRAAIDSRHFVLGGALASSAIFGFPVFCLICPIGLTFATVLLVMRLFAGGDMTWAVVAVPALLIVEVIVFRKWCATFCPLSAMMSLVAKANKTFKPSINESACLETTKGATCGRCTQACPEGIDVRHPELGASWSECTRCRACVDACPANAVSIPFLARRSPKSEQISLAKCEDGRDDASESIERS